MQPVNATPSNPMKYLGRRMEERNKGQAHKQRKRQMDNTTLEPKHQSKSMIYFR